MRADFSPRTSQEVCDARRKACLDEESHQSRADDRSLVRRLNDNRVAGDYCRGRHAGQNCEWKIPGCDNDTNAAGPPMLDIRFTSNGLCAFRPAKVTHDAGVEVAEIDCFGDVSVRLWPVFAGLQNFESAKVRFVPVHEGGDFFENS